MTSIVNVDEKTPEIVIRSLFKKYDKDNSGSISKRELAALLEDLGFTDKTDVVQLLVDKDANGTISVEEFVSWWRSKDKIRNLTGERYQILMKAYNMFRKYDTNNDSKISVDEFKKLLEDLKLGGNAADAVKALDTNGNGTIEFGEFLVWLNWLK